MSLRSVYSNDDLIFRVKYFCSVYLHDLTKVLQDPPFTWTQLSMREALVLY